MEGEKVVMSHDRIHLCEGSGDTQEGQGGLGILWRNTRKGKGGDRTGKDTGGGRIILKPKKLRKSIKAKRKRSRHSNGRGRAPLEGGHGTPWSDSGRIPGETPEKKGKKRFGETKSLTAHRGLQKKTTGQS